MSDPAGHFNRYDNCIFARLAKVLSPPLLHFGLDFALHLRRIGVVFGVGQLAKVGEIELGEDIKESTCEGERRIS